MLRLTDDCPSIRFYFPGFLVGPYLEYSSYMSLIDESIFKSTAANGNVHDTKSARKVPRGRKRVAYRKMIMGLIFLGLFVTLGGSFNYGMATKSWFTARSLTYRYVCSDQANISCPVLTQTQQDCILSILRCYRKIQILCHLDFDRGILLCGP